MGSAPLFLRQAALGARASSALHLFCRLVFAHPVMVQVRFVYGLDNALLHHQVDIPGVVEHVDILRRIAGLQVPWLGPSARSQIIL